MSTELTTVGDNWLELADQLKDLPAPYQREIFLLECHVAGITLVEDGQSKASELSKGDPLVLRLDANKKDDPFSIAIYAATGERIG